MRTTAKNTRREVIFQPQVDKACGLDIHKDKIVGFISDKEGQNQEWKEFGTFTKQLYETRDWIKSKEIKYCLMESTGVYWKTLYNILTEGGIEVIVANPQYVKQIPKAKTDKKDAAWLCKLRINGIDRKSFIPDATQRSLREFTRQRIKYVQLRSRTLSVMVKILETANIKIRSVLSNIHTKTGYALIVQLANGVTDIDTLLKHCHGKVRAKAGQMKEALVGYLNEAQRMELQMLIDDIIHFDNQLVIINRRIDTIIKENYQKSYECLQTISGVGEQSAEIILAEIGDNVKTFPTADHLTNWCGVAPGNDESADKKRNTSIKKGNKYLRIAMVQVAWAAVRMKDSYWRALFNHLTKRMKPKKAIIAIARRMLKVIYKTLQNQNVYTEKGLTHFMHLQTLRKQYLISISH
jgi:transposase